MNEIDPLPTNSVAPDEQLPTTESRRSRRGETVVMMSLIFGLMFLQAVLAPSGGSS